MYTCAYEYAIGMIGRCWGPGGSYALSFDIAKVFAISEYIDCEEQRNHIQRH